MHDDPRKTTGYCDHVVLLNLRRNAMRNPHSRFKVIILAIGSQESVSEPSIAQDNLALCEDRDSSCDAIDANLQKLVANNDGTIFRRVSPAGSCGSSQ